MVHMTPKAADLILAELEREGGVGLTADQLASRVSRHPGNVRRVLNQLRHAELVRRSADAKQAIWSRTDMPAPPPRSARPKPPPQPAYACGVRPPDYELLTKLAAEAGVSRAAIFRAALHRYHAELEQQRGTPIAS